MIIPLRSEVYVVTKINKKTSALMFKDLEVGDLLSFNIDFKHVGGNGGRSYSVVITATNVRTGAMNSDSINAMANKLSMFELELV